MKIDWKKQPPNGWQASVGPLAIKIIPKGDGRWSWEVARQDAAGPMASGVTPSLGAAKNVTEQFIKRSGLI